MPPTQPPNTEPAPDFPEVLTTAMAAELLHVHVEYLRRMVREGRIPAHRFPEGREIRFLRDELITWVRSQPGHDQSPSAASRRELLNGPDLTGRTVVITGANSGIGKEAAVGLAAMGATVVVAARNRAKGDAAVDDIKSRSGRDAVELAELDLASTASIRVFADAFLATHDRLDVLLNNAGLTLRKRQETADGFEMTFGVNHLGHFLLTALLRDRLVASAPARVVTVASDAHRYARGGLDFDDLMATKRYRPFLTYGRSKLANILFTNELARRLDGTGVTANVLHPGFVASNFAREGDTGAIGNVAMILGRPFAISPAKGAETSVFLASSPMVEEVTGQYFVKCALAKTSAAGTDTGAAQRLWAVSEQLLD